MPKILILIILFVFKLNFALSAIIKEINVVGNDRISKNTIINFSEIKIGEETSSKVLNNSLKKLYDTNFFELIDFKLDNNILTINVTEYPIVEQIIINGIKAKKNIKKMKDNMKLKEKNPFIESFVQQDLNKILNIFKQSGFYFVKIAFLFNSAIQVLFNNTVKFCYKFSKF